MDFKFYTEFSMEKLDRVLKGLKEHYKTRKLNAQLEGENKPSTHLKREAGARGHEELPIMRCAILH